MYNIQLVNLRKLLQLFYLISDEVALGQRLLPEIKKDLLWCLKGFIHQEVKIIISMHMLHNKTSKYMKQKSIRVNGGYSTPFSAIDKND